MAVPGVTTLHCKSHLQKCRSTQPGGKRKRRYGSCLLPQCCSRQPLSRPCCRARRQAITSSSSGAPSVEPQSEHEAEAATEPDSPESPKRTPETEAHAVETPPPRREARRSAVSQLEQALDTQLSMRRQLAQQLKVCLPRPSTNESGYWHSRRRTAGR